MTCGEARRLLWPDEGPRRTTDEVLRAQAHAGACEACRGFFQDMRTLAERVRGAAPRPAAPRAVRDRLFKAVARARTAAPAAPPRRSGWLWGVAAGLAATVGIVVGAQVLRHLRPEEAMTILAEDHLGAVNGEAIASSDSLTVARWLATRLSFSVEVPLFPTATLKGGRLCVVDHVRGAVLEYDLGGRTLSYFVVPSPGSTRPRAGSMPELRFASGVGYRVVAWQDAGRTHALVADLPEARLVELARYCMHQMMAIIHRLGRGMPG